jgi:prolyl-tRNA synthetase
VATFLGVSTESCLKTLVVHGDDGLVALVLRGVDELNEIKASKLPGVAAPLKFAGDADIEAAIGCKPGSIGPVGLTLPVYVDTHAAATADFVCGANRDGFHFTGVNWDRDVTGADDRVVDLRTVRVGDPAPDGQGILQFVRGIEVGHIFQLGRAYSEPMQASVLDQNGESAVTLMGCYGMGVTRLVAAIIEQKHDDAGIRWPEPIAPFHVHVVALNLQKSEAVRAAAEDIYGRLAARGVEVLFDDRDERPGVKFADADLIGIPHRIVIGERGLKDGTVEYRSRSSSDNESVPAAAVVEVVLARLT